MKVSVILPVKNEEQIIEQCLLQLLHQSALPNEVIVVDNSSTDRSRKNAEQLIPLFQSKGISLVILSCLHGNQIEARRLGFGTAKHELIISIDADSVLDPRWIERAKAVFSDRANIVGIGGPVLYDRWTATVSSIAIFWYFRFLNPKNYFFYVCNAAFRKSAYRETDQLRGCRLLMDSYRLHRPYDDLYLAFQLKTIGHVVAVPELKIRALARVNGNRPTVWSLYRESYYLLRESLFLISYFRKSL